MPKQSMTKQGPSSQEELLRQLEGENPENFQQELQNEIVEQRADNRATLTTMGANDTSHVRVDEHGRMFLRNSEPLIDARGSQITSANELGWKVIDAKTLPSQGLFYPVDLEISIRSAERWELRQWSTIDVTDRISVSKKTNMIFERCLKMRSLSRPEFAWQDLAEMDNVCLLTMIHEISFPNGENYLGIPFNCQCGEHKTIPLTSNMLSHSFNISEKIWKFYNAEQRCFSVHSDKLNEDIVLFVPTLGTVAFLTKLVMNMQAEGRNVDTSITRLMPFFVKDWRRLRDGQMMYNKMAANIDNWSKNKFLFIDGFVSEFNSCVNITTVKFACDKCGTVLERPLFFRGGFTIKDFFSVSSSFDDLI